MEPLRSPQYEVADAFEANELFQRNGWTDGLPIVPPTEALVRRFLEAAGLAPDDVVGIEPVRRRRITAEKVAIAAVMAGCLPEYMPVVVARVQAMCEPEFGLHGMHREHRRQRAVHRGERSDPPRARHERHPQRARQRQPRRTRPSAARCGFSSSTCWAAFPASSTARRSAIPGKFTFCVAEDEEDSPWLPLAAERGCRPGASAVTVLCGRVAAPDHERVDARPAGHRSRPMPPPSAPTCSRTRSGRETTPWSWCPSSTAQIFAEAGWSKQDVREYVYERARVSRGASGARSARRGRRRARTRTRSTPRCARPTICW